MKRCKSDNICILRNDKEHNENTKSLHKSFSCPNFTLELNDSYSMTKNKEGEDSRSTISSQFNVISSYNTKKNMGSVLLSSFQSKLNTISSMFTKTSNNFKIFSKNNDNSNNKSCNNNNNNKDKEVQSYDFYNNESLAFKSEYSFSKNSIHSEYNNRTKFRFKPRHHRHKCDEANCSTKSNIQIRDNDGHVLTKMNILSKRNKDNDGNNSSKSKSFTRLRHGTSKSFKSFKSFKSNRTIDHDNNDISFKVDEEDEEDEEINHLTCTSKSSENATTITTTNSTTTTNTTNTIPELSENSSNEENEKINHKESIKGVKKKKSKQELLHHERLLHSKQNSIISKNSSIKSKIMKISKISSMKKKGKLSHNELSKEFKQSNDPDELIANSQDVNSQHTKLESTDSFSEWFNSISSIPQQQSTQRKSQQQTSLQSPLSNEILFDTQEATNNPEIPSSITVTDCSIPNSLHSNDLLDESNKTLESANKTNNPSTELSGSRDVNSNSNNNDDDDNNSNNNNNNNNNNKDNQQPNNKIGPPHETSITKQLPPLPLSMKCKGEMVKFLN